MQNNFEELWCLMDWAVPGCLGKKSYFMDHFAKAMQIGQKIDSDNAQHQQVGLKYAAGLSFCLAVVNIELKPIFQFLDKARRLINNVMPFKQCFGFAHLAPCSQAVGTIDQSVHSVKDHWDV